jgi:dUTPase
MKRIATRSTSYRNGLTISLARHNRRGLSGRIQVLLVNLGSRSVVVSACGLQLVIARQLYALILLEAASLDKTSRGSGGFGSTGVEAPQRKRL